MSGTEPLSQDSSFYTGCWTRAVEKIILQKLRLARWSGDWESGGNTTANYDLISRPAVQYDALRNTIEASEMTWRTIAGEDPHYLIYKEGPKTEWGLMRSVFAPIVSSTWSGFGQAYSITSDVVDQPSRSADSLLDSRLEEF
ncbi:hypothetical protein C2S53_013109 [Perilla frutescens var. hirtella]|uniref:Uncharacterized protein n=1 Tax=Perilla frutescens var. hirtella TaxID=608512 RepID=A0AAD4P260_PERFH|nr:hypothetical protein C2S53_013109 [Perilla frutescens var. hirtella]